MSDFFKEVDEDYRRDQMAAFWKRYQVPIILVAVGIVAAAGGWRFWSDAKIAAAEKVNARYEQAADLAEQGKADQAEAAYRAIAKDGPTGYAALSRFRAAEVQAGVDPEGAAKAFDTIAGDDSLAASLRDTARFRGALLRLDLEEPKAFEQRYGHFTEPGFTYQNGMRELLALAALKRQDFAAAGRQIDAILMAPDAPPSLRARAQAFRLLINGGPTTAMTSQPKPAQITPPLAGAEPPPTATLPSTTPSAATPSAATPSAATPGAPKPPTTPNAGATPKPQAVPAPNLPVRAPPAPQPPPAPH